MEEAGAGGRRGAMRLEHPENGVQQGLPASPSSLMKELGTDEKGSATG